MAENNYEFESEGEPRFGVFSGTIEGLSTTEDSATNEPMLRVHVTESDLQERPLDLPLSPFDTKKVLMISLLRDALAISLPVVCHYRQKGLRRYLERIHIRSKET